MTRGAGQDPIVADARRVLATWRAPSEIEDRRRDEYLGFLATHEAAATSRDLRAGHLTASAVVVEHDGRRVLLTLHPRAGQWFQLGGHLEPSDTSLRCAAAREAAEESGIDGLSVSALPIGLARHPARCRDSAGRVGPTQHWDVAYVAVAPAGARARRSAESQDLAWFPLDSLPAGADEVVRGLVERVRALGAV